MTKRLFYQQSEPGSRIAATAQRLSVKARIMMALFALMLIPQGTWAQTTTYYDLWIDGTQVSSDNESNVLGDGKVSYDAANNKLILNHARLDGGIWTTMSDLNIHFIGNDCSISPASGIPSNCIMSSATTPGTLKFTKENDGDKLELYNANQHYTAIRGFSAIDDVNGLPLETQIPYKIVNDGYYRLRREITNSLDTATTNIDYAIVSANTVYPLWLSSQQVTSTNASSILGWGGYDSRTKTLTLTGLISDVTGASGNPYYGVTTGVDNLTIKLVALVGDRNYIKCKGTDDIAFKGYGNASTITFSPDASNPGSLEMYVANSDGAHWFEGVTPSYSGTLAFHDDGYDGSTFYVSRVAPVTNYDLWIGDVQVTSANKGDILTAKGDSIAGTNMTFDPTTSTLTLDNVSSQVGIYSELPNLKIYLKGANTISNTSRDCAFWTKTTGGNLTFECESGATLDMQSNSTYSVIQGFNTVNYAAGTYLSSPTVPALYGFNGNKNLVDCTWTGMTTNLCSAVITSVEQYQLWIDDKQITAANAGNVFNDGKVSYNAASKTLYLNGVSYLNPIFSGLDALTIEFNGTNSLGTSSGYNGFIMSSDPTADLKFKLGTTGNGTLSLYESVGRSVICGFASVTLDGVVYLDASAVYDTTNKQMKTGGYTATNLSIGVQGYPLWIGSTQVTSANAGNIRNDGTLSYVHDATNNTGTLTLNGATLSGDISTSMSDLTIHVKGNNKISAASNCIRSSATTPGKLTFTKDTGGKLELDNASNHYSVIKGFNDVAGVPLETKAPYEIYINGDYYRLKQSLVAAGDTASIDNVWVYADTTYPIWVDGHQATSVSANNILGDAGSTASFNSNTLTLNVANITGAIVSSLTSTLTISVKGNSTVSGGIFQTSNATADLVVSKDATATGNVSLIVNPGREAAIRGFSDFTYDDFAPFSSDGATDLSDGISYDNSKALKYNGTALGAVYLRSKTDLATAGLTFTMASVAYTGAAVVLPTTVTMDDGTTQTALTQATDYTVTGYKASDKTALTSAPIAAGNYYATIQGNGIYTGTADAAFTIDQADFTPPSVISIAAVTAQTYTGSEIKPTPTVTFAGTQLVPGTDFDYSYANNTNAALSTATPAPTVTINGKGNFKGTNSVTFTIDPKSVVGLEVNVSGTYTYTGSAIEPTNIEVKDGSKTLTVGTDYNITSYSNNTNAADANDPTAPPTVTITGIGNYTNSTSGTFTILDRTPAIAFAAGRTYKTFYDANETFRVPDDVTAYVVTGVSGSSVTLRRVYYISAGNPVLLESTPGVTTTVDKTETYADNYLRYGTGAAQPKHYVLYNNEFVKATGDLTNKVYLDATTLIAGARTLTIDRNNSATAIEAIVEEAADGEQWYDMQGRKINKPTKDGLYIKNGKKVVVNNK